MINIQEVMSITNRIEWCFIRLKQSFLSFNTVIVASFPFCVPIINTALVSALRDIAIREVTQTQSFACPLAVVVPALHLVHSSKQEDVFEFKICIIAFFG